MNLELYKAFFYTVKYGTISKASEYMYITQPAVSRSIQQLEDSLKCSLFFRTSKGVKLTPEGELLYKYVEQAFNFISAGESKISEVINLLAGEVRIGVSDTICKYYLIPYLKLFRTLHPAVKIQVICPTTPVIIQLLKTGKIDFGIINLPYHDDSLNFQDILKVQDCFVTGEKYKHLSRQMQHLDEIVKHPMILLEKSSNSRSHIDSYFKANNLSVVPDLELGNIDLLTQFAKYDFGIACVIKNFIQDELDNRNLYEVKPIEKIPARSIGVTWLKNVPLSSAAKALISNLDYLDNSEI